MNKAFYLSNSSFWISNGRVIASATNHEFKGYLVMFKNRIRLVERDYQFQEIELKSKTSELQMSKKFQATNVYLKNEYIKEKYYFYVTSQFCIELTNQNINGNDFLIVLENEDTFKIWCFLLEIFLDQSIDISMLSSHPQSNTIYKENIFDSILTETISNDQLVNTNRISSDGNCINEISNRHPIEFYADRFAVLTESFADKHKFFNVINFFI
jgi:hypothetical protein